MNEVDGLDSSSKALFNALEAGLRVLPDKPEETLEATFRSLYLAAAGTPSSARGAMKVDLPKLSTEQVATLAGFVQQRCAGVPLAHITGRQYFMGLEMLAGPGALIPRMETEILGGEVLRLASMIAEKAGSVTVLDVCTGSGNIPLAVATLEPRSRLFGGDITPESIALAKENAHHLGLEGSVDFRVSDLFEAFKTEEFTGKCDIVSCNPPYIPSAKVGAMDPEISQHEPKEAFDGGSLGIGVVSKLIREAPGFLKPGGYLCFEVGLGQAVAFERMLKRNPVYRDVHGLTDSKGQVRTLVACV
jgi:release factor glutamine methyltransferase